MRISVFKTKVKDISFDVIESSSAIHTIICPGNENVKALSKHLLDYGIDAKAILAPTVPVGKERLRICLHAYNTTKEIDKLISCINEFIQ